MDMMQQRTCNGLHLPLNTHLYIFIIIYTGQFYIYTDIHLVPDARLEDCFFTRCEMRI